MFADSFCIPTIPHLYRWDRWLDRKRGHGSHCCSPVAQGNVEKICRIWMDLMVFYVFWGPKFIGFHWISQIWSLSFQKKKRFGVPMSGESQGHHSPSHGMEHLWWSRPVSLARSRAGRKPPASHLRQALGLVNSVIVLWKCGYNNVINHPFGNGLYELSMVIWGMVYHSCTQMMEI